MYFITEIKYKAYLEVNGVLHDSPVMGATQPVHPSWIKEISKVFNLKSNAEEALEEFKEKHKVDTINRVNNDISLGIVEVETTTTPFNELDRVKLVELLELLTIEKEKSIRAIEIERALKV